MSEKSEQDREIFERAKEFVDETREALSSSRDVPDDVRGQLKRRLNELHHRIEDEDAEAVRREFERTREFVEEHAELQQKSALREYAESIGLAILFALFLRGFVIEAFKIPTGSMIPTLLVGDHLFVNKFIYGVRVPFTETYLTRFDSPVKGEVVVFTFPVEEAQNYIAKQPPSRRECIERSSLDDEKDFIKRIVGTEGDTIEIRDHHLYVNGEPVDREFIKKEPTGKFLHPHQIHETESLNDHEYTIRYTESDKDFGPVQVKDDHVFMMGDNRDNSSDSRCWGQVPVEHIKGRAMFIWWSIGPDSARWDRIGQVIH